MAIALRHLSTMRGKIALPGALLPVVVVGLILIVPQRSFAQG